MPAAGSILVLLEQDNGDLHSISLELLGAARRIATELGQAVTAVALGTGSATAASEVIKFGADEGFHSINPEFDRYTNDVWTSALTTVAAQIQPSVVLFGQTEIGRDLAPRFAIRTGTAAAMDCIDLAVRDGKLLMTRPCYGGNAHATYSSRTMPQVATVRPRSQASLPRDESRNGTVSSLELDLVTSTAVVAERELVESEGQRLEDARIIISGGRGLGSAEAFSELATLAQVLDGAVAASRAAGEGPRLNCRPEPIGEGPKRPILDNLPQSPSAPLPLRGSCPAAPKQKRGLAAPLLCFRNLRNG